jgi:DNA replicative helicase MCM subunit Mcm2 (Cdc46/Mcm family)
MFSAMKGTCSDERVMVALRHYTPTSERVAELARMAEDAVQRVKPSDTTPVRELGDTRQLVMEIIREHQAPRGIAVEDVITKAGEKGISQGDVLAAIEALIVEDECYQPQKGYVRPL